MIFLVNGYMLQAKPEIRKTKSTHANLSGEFHDTIIKITISAFISAFGWYGLGLFQLILSHRILFNHPKPAELQCSCVPDEHAALALVPSSTCFI